MVEILVNKLMGQKEKGLKVQFKTDGQKYYIYVANSLSATMNKKEWNKFYASWKIATSLLAV